ncbi:hypothetical protein OSB04_008512 [Centaurea solstitialis]|uniref:Bulb-type lectin domain-containing protein n=1 Tax=Centaurea solstitialis TaxID=347529 RepID=A0AA38U585_9ASTR|nr:hypothetical protein OSB04_008512 [Centaurea solstitialis]
MASTSSSLIIFFCFLFTLLFISQATVPPSETFRYVNEGEFGDSVERSTEYDASYRSLPLFTTPFRLAFYNTTPNAYTLGLRMGIRGDRSLVRFVWDANRGNPVRENATLSFGSDGNLVLAEADGRIKWQTNTANKGVVGFAILPTATSCSAMLPVVLSGKALITQPTPSCSVRASVSEAPISS